MIHTQEGRISDVALESKANNWFANADDNGKLTLYKASACIMKWTVEVYGIKGEEILLKETFQEIDKSQNYLSKKELLFLIKEA